MPTKKKLRIRPRLNYKHQIKSGGYQVLLEIRNIQSYPDKEIRISLLDEHKKKIHLKKDQIAKGVVINHYNEKFLKGSIH